MNGDDHRGDSNAKSFDDNNNNSSYIKCGKCESLDEGTFAFMHWLNSDDKRSLSFADNPIVLLKFINDKHTILHDTRLHADVDVEINKGIPYCKYCKEDDCAHVGFAICVEQLYGHRRSGTEERIEDIIT